MPTVIGSTMRCTSTSLVASGVFALSLPAKNCAAAAPPREQRQDEAARIEPLPGRADDQHDAGQRDHRQRETVAAKGRAGTKGSADNDQDRGSGGSTTATVTGMKATEER